MVDSENKSKKTADLKKNNSKESVSRSKSDKKNKHNISSETLGSEKKVVPEVVKKSDTVKNNISVNKNSKKTEKSDGENHEIKKVNPIKLLKKKKEIIKKLRELVNGIENKETFNNVKELQNSWRDIGHIKNSKEKSLWITYNALLDRFYDNRSIYFELKELDRKKNLEIKTKLCEDAESLLKETNIMKSVSKLNDIHTEFKHIGPVNKCVLNEIWERLKGASDDIYKKKKEFISNIKESLNENLKKKLKLLDEINKLKVFNSDDIRVWNLKSKEVLSLKDKWNGIGGVPKSSSRNVSKEFWNAFKEFYNQKSIFFKKIDESYKINLNHKKDLIDKVNSIKDSVEWEKTSKEIQNLQKEWKKIGKVPIKYKDSIYKEFKESCDFFYDKKRVEDKESIKIYEKNFKLKENICDKILSLSSSNDFDQDEFFKLQVKFLEVGHVPKENIDLIKEKYKKSIDVIIKKLSKSMNKEDFDKFKFIIELNSLAKNPYSKNKIIKKKSDIIKKINKIQSEIKNLKNNIYYLKESVAAENLKKEYMAKIDDSDKEIESLKLQLNLINKV